VARSGQKVAGLTWHAAPDGGACFPDGAGWIYVSNSESGPDVGGGVSMVRFAKDGAIVEARRILGNTARNCAGGATPWHTWLSCEEIPQGKVHECFPTEVRDPVARPALGVFNHEAVAVHEETKTLYLTEDQPDGALYRFRPDRYPDLSAGTLEVLTESGSDLAWIPVPDPSAATAETRTQVPDTKRFPGGEGICISDGAVFFTTKGDNHVTKYDPGTDTLTVVYDGSAAGSVLQGVDNITAGSTGDLFVAEDGGDMQLVQLIGSVAHAVAQVVGADGSEITGPAFSPDGARLYFSSQRLPGVTYEVSGPWAG
jgi:secreted PhoX family phosphatase